MNIWFFFIVYSFSPFIRFVFFFLKSNGNIRKYRFGLGLLSFLLSVYLWPEFCHFVLTSFSLSLCVYVCVSHPQSNCLSFWLLFFSIKYFFKCGLDNSILVMILKYVELHEFCSFKSLYTSLIFGFRQNSSNKTVHHKCFLSIQIVFTVIITPHA